MKKVKNVAMMFLFAGVIVSCSKSEDFNKDNSSEYAIRKSSFEEYFFEGALENEIRSFGRENFPAYQVEVSASGTSFELNSDENVPGPEYPVDFEGKSVKIILGDECGSLPHGVYIWDMCNGLLYNLTGQLVGSMGSGGDC